MAEVLLTVQYGEHGTQSMYFKIEEGDVARSSEAYDDVVVDFDSHSNVLGIEILSPQALRRLNSLARDYSLPQLSFIKHRSALQTAFA